MSPCAKFGPLALLLLSLAVSSPGHAQLYSPPDSLNTNAPPTLPPAVNPPGTGSPSTGPSSAVDNDPSTPMLRQAMQNFTEGQFDAALQQVNAALKISPQNLGAYSLRGGIYSEQKQWDLAAKDYQTILQIDDKNVLAKFNLAEIKFRQKLYDDARSGFLALEQDPDWGDLATYKVFLCDLYGGHEDVAAKEHDAFDQVGSNASFYFGNAAWSLYHHQTEDGRSWLTSAVRIYSQTKVNLYAASLKDLGYLPLPPPPPQ